MRPLKILHVMRAPVGGLFRHVADLASAQAARGHAVGIVADATTSATQAEAVLADLAPQMALGITRMPMSRHIGWGDIAARQRLSALARSTGANVLHGHGAKGGAYARLAAQRGAVRVYTPHGGSLHYSRSSPVGFLYLTLERLLIARTDLFLFESAYGRDTFHARVGEPKSLVRVIHNGVSEEEFAPVVPNWDATDVLFVGELRMLKGVDVLIDALAIMSAEGRPTSATIVGDGPDAEALRQRVCNAGLSGVRFAGVVPARFAFAKGRVLIVPSRAESLPYIVLEAAAAGLPMIATSVGGIPEIFGPDADKLTPPGDARSLAAVIAAYLRDSEITRDLSLRLQARVRAQFSIEAMSEAVLAAYGTALDRR